MRDYASCSFWLESCGDRLIPRPSLDRSIDCDVAILGAGYTGLWTAYYLLKRRPGLRVVLLEKEIAGFGASGRNGGWCSSKLNIGLDLLEERHGRAAACCLHEAMHGAVLEIGRVCAEEGIAADYVRGGALFIARGEGQLPLLKEYADSLARFGFGDRQEILDAAATASRIAVRDARGAIFFPGYASIHPGRLARGLARVVECLGGAIYEQTPVVEFLPGPRAGAGPDRGPRLRAAGGEVRAGAVVLAGEAYLTRFPALHRQLLPIYSLIVLTEPLPDEVWSRIGWSARECVASFRLSVDYLSRTPDGRILFGGRGAPYHFASAIEDSFDRDGPTHAMLRGMARDWFPQIESVRFTHAWGGPLGMPRDWMPTVAYDRSTGIASARGYTGQGVSATNLAGRTLCDLLTGEDSELTRLPIVGHRSPAWEPEPLRWLAVRYIQEAFSRLDARAERTGRPPTGRTLAERLSRH
jgi:glycine/D-amino acid oxidase-like deaminating enzyme